MAELISRFAQTASEHDADAGWASVERATPAPATPFAAAPGAAPPKVLRDERPRSCILRWRQQEAVRGGLRLVGRGIGMTRLQESAYNAQLAAGLPVSGLAQAVLTLDNGSISHEHCATYIRAVQQMNWFMAAFPTHSDPVTVVGGRGRSHADALTRRIKVGTNNRYHVGECEQACLHELAHIVSPDCGPDGELREPRLGRDSSKGHHHAWRVNFVLIARKTLGKQAALRLRHEFNQWGLATRK
jgi:hypothetical protein